MENNMTYQEMFNVAYKGLKSQNFYQSVVGGLNSDCQYRGANGMRCALGWLIPDEKYEVVFENKTPSWNLSQATNPKGYKINQRLCAAAGLNNKDKIIFAQELQYCHDDATSPEVMKNKLKYFAKKYKLTIPQ